MNALLRRSGVPHACGSASRRLGFSMVEMIVTLAILGILVTLAIPAFQDRIIRNQITTAIPLADIAKPPIAASWLATQTMPADNAAAGLPAPEKIVSTYVIATTIRDGAIDITFGNSANGTIGGKILTLRPAVVPDTPVVPVSWVCGNARTPGQMVAMGENRTNIPPNYLPVSCRATGP